MRTWIGRYLKKGNLELSNVFTLYDHKSLAGSLQSCPTLGDPMNCSLPGSSVHGIPQARILQWVALPSSKGSSQLRDQTHLSCVSCTGEWVLYH